MVSVLKDWFQKDKYFRVQINENIKNMEKDKCIYISHLVYKDNYEPLIVDDAEAYQDICPIGKIYNLDSTQDIIIDKFMYNGIEIDNLCEMLVKIKVKDIFLLL